MTRLRMRGFTLVEAVAVIAIMGVVAAMVAIFIRQPVESYIDAARRAELTDVADTALRRIGRDVRAALPNSIRITTAGGVRYLEFLQTSGGGRYRAQRDVAGNGDPLDFTVVAGDTTFDVIGPVPPAPAPPPTPKIVVYNLGPGSTESDAYTGNNSSDYTGLAGSNIAMAAKQFPFASPGRRFHVVEYPVTYACDLGSRELRRYWGYAIAAAQPTPPVTPNTALLATNVSDCEFTYSANPATQRNAIVSLRLEIEQSQERVRLFQQVHVVNVP